MTVRIRLAALVLLVLLVPAVIAPTCQPGPNDARDVVATVSGCNRIDVVWTPPPIEPAFSDIMIQRRLAATVPGGRTTLPVFAKFVPPGSLITIRSRDAAGQVVGNSPSTSFSTPRCNSPANLRVKVLLADLNPPAGSGRPWTASEIGNLFFGATNSVRDAIRKNSYDQQDVTGDVSGYYEVDGAAHCNWNGENFNPCSGTLISAVIAAADPSINFANYDRIVVLAGGKGGGGTAGFTATTNEGRKAWLQVSPRLTQILHELGHIANAGDPSENYVVHAGRVGSCANGRIFPANPGDLRADCSGTGETDDIDPMTSITADSKSIHYNAFHKERMGWIPPERVGYYDPGWTLQPQEIVLYDLTDEPPAGVKQMIRIPIGDFGYEYFVEHRNERLDDGTLHGTQLTGAIIRLGGRRSLEAWGGAHGGVVDTLAAFSGPNLFALNGTQRVFDDPVNNVRIEWLGFPNGSQEAVLRVGPSSGTQAP